MMSPILRLALSLALVVPVPATLPDTTAASDKHKEVLTTISDFRKKDPSIQKFFDGSVGYAVFPTIGKGAIGIGGAHGTGELIVGGKAIGKVSMTQVTIGLALGGQSYSEIIFFEKQETLDGFKKNDFAFAAQASAVALASGAAFNARYRDGVAVFTVAKGGLMGEASVGGQKFSFTAY